MSIYVAHLEDSKVVQVTVHEDSYALQDDEVLIGPYNLVGIGATWDGSIFHPKVEEV